MRWRLTERAASDLSGIADWSRAAWGEAQTERYLDALRAACDGLADLPENGKARHDLSPGLRSWPFEQHVIFYRRAGTELIVMRILHKRMDVEAAF